MNELGIEWNSREAQNFQGGPSTGSSSKKAFGLEAGVRRPQQSLGLQLLRSQRKIKV